MNAAAQALWDHIETSYLGDEDRSNWSNTAAYGTTVDEDHIDEMVDEKFGRYNYFIRFTNGSEQFKLKVLPLQNKFSRSNHAYGTYRGGENMVNIVAWPASGGANVFNLHVQVRRLGYALKARQAAAKKVPDAGGWMTA